MSPCASVALLARLIGTGDLRCFTPSRKRSCRGQSLRPLLVAKRNPTLGALILSLPLVSLLAFTWLWLDTGNKEAIATLSQSTFWFVLLTLPMLLLLPALLRQDMSFWLALLISCALTVSLYFAAGGHSPNSASRCRQPPTRRASWGGLGRRLRPAPFPL